jgi:cyclopropane-fatty-acyl-phospholipid synthase
MTSTDVTSNDPAVIWVTLHTVDDIARDLPFVFRKAVSFACQIEAGSLIITVPDGRKLGFKGVSPGPYAEMMVNDLTFAKRLVSSGDIGFAESYLRGEWESPNLTAFLQLFCANHRIISTLLSDRPLVRYWQLFKHWLNRNTKTGSRKNIHAHYDLGNAFYSQWLDPSMTYSSALFESEPRDLYQGQQNKYAALAKQTAITENHHVLEIGCGWGGFAEFAAKEIGCHVTGLTISKEQFDFAKSRIFKAGLNEKVEIKLQDYRDENGLYDRIASIEMFEAVGEQFWPVYFQTLKERLKAGGKAGLQVITIQDRFFETYRREVDFIRRYIFPGGMLPSPSIMKKLGDAVGMAIQHEYIFGQHYADTLDSWRQKFRAAWPELTSLGFDERFRRLWEYYLAYCEAGFREGNIDVRQIVYAKS